MKAYEDIDKLVQAVSDRQVQGVARILATPQEGEKTVATVPPELQRYYVARGMLDMRLTVLRTVQRQVTGSVGEAIAHLLKHPDTDEPLEEAGDRLGRMADMMDMIFWLEIRLRFNLWSCNLGLRRDWAIVQQPVDELPEEDGEDLSKEDCDCPACQFRRELENQGIAAVTCDTGVEGLQTLRITGEGEEALREVLEALAKRRAGCGTVGAEEPPIPGQQRKPPEQN